MIPDWFVLLATGWQPPEQFVTKGHDEKTDIFGTILRGSSVRRLNGSMAEIPIVAPFGPVVGRAMIRELDRADAFDRLHAVLQRTDQSQGCSVVRRQRFAVHGGEKGDAAII